MTRTFLGKGMEIVQQDLQQILLRGKGDGSFAETINKEVSLLPPVDNLRIINKSLNNQLKNLKIKWKNLKCMTIVLCSNGYPGKYKTGKIIKNIKKINLDRKSFIFHAGTYLNDERVYSSGGRVLNVTSTGMFFRKIRVKIIKIMKKLNWKYGFFRKDIGSRII